MRKWLARLTFSFFILALAFAWEARRSGERGAADRKTAFYTVTAVCLALGLIGVRERHRRPPDDRSRDD